MNSARVATTTPDGVPLLDLLDEQLGRRLGLRGLLDHGHDPRHDRVLGGSVDPHAQGAGAVERCRRTPRRRRPWPRERLAGDGGLVDLAGPSITFPSAPMRSPGRTRTTSPTSSSAVSTTSSSPSPSAGSPLGGQVEQPADGVGGAPGGERLQRAGGGEDDDQQGAVEDLPDRRRAAARRRSSADPRPGSSRAAPAARRAPAPSRRPRSRPGTSVHHTGAGPRSTWLSPPAANSIVARAAHRTSDMDSTDQSRDRRRRTVGGAEGARREGAPTA